MSEKTEKPASPKHQVDAVIRKPVIRCDFLIVDFESETIEIKMPNEVKNKRFFKGSVYVNFDSCTVDK